MTEFYRTAVIELKVFLNTDKASNYTSLLYQLISKADAVNLAKLRAVYPDYVQAYEDWQASPNETAFFNQVLST